jgi:predicted Rossmann fold nucleotide-binding protein DprA/Smf involved in DNA uptake
MQSEKLIEKLNKMRIFCMFYGCEDYPKLLCGIETPPMVLYGIGDKSLLSCHLLSIVGPRKPSRYGKDVVYSFVKQLLSAGIIPVSDLAYGIDGEVAEAAVKNKGLEHFSVQDLKIIIQIVSDTRYCKNHPVSSILHVFPVLIFSHLVKR